MVEKVNLDLYHYKLLLVSMGMVLFAKDNEDHKVVFQHMNLVLLMLLLNHFYLRQLLESMD